jgi:sec-independent protein translocase protein TatA
MLLLYWPRRFLPVQEALMFRLGVPELLIIFVIVLFLFGAKRLPEMGKGIGEGIKNFKNSFKGDGHA